MRPLRITLRWSAGPAGESDCADWAPVDPELDAFPATGAAGEVTGERSAALAVAEWSFLLHETTASAPSNAIVMALMPAVTRGCDRHVVRFGRELSRFADNVAASASGPSGAAWPIAMAPDE